MAERWEGPGGVQVPTYLSSDEHLQPLLSYVNKTRGVTVSESCYDRAGGAPTVGGH